MLGNESVLDPEYVSALLAFAMIFLLGLVGYIATVWNLNDPNAIYLPEKASKESAV